MAKELEWLDGNRIKVDPPKHPKKITGTRFAAILGLSPWTTPFEAWCAITRVYEKPFEETIYTAAGKIIEPKQAAWVKENLFWKNLVSPTDVYGEDYFSRTRGDFFPESDIFGGMWDYLFTDKTSDSVDTVLEMKSTKRAEDWARDTPEYYALQAALYAYLKNCDNVRMVASFLEPGDYQDPDSFVCSNDNTIDRAFRVSERYGNFERDYIDRARKWWNDHVVTGISPPYDEAKDAEILKALRTRSVTPGTSLNDLLAEAESLKAQLDAHAAEIAPIEQRYEIVTKAIKGACIDRFTDSTDRVELSGNKFVFTVTKSETARIDKAALKRDGLLEQYSDTSTSYRMTCKEKED